MSRIEVLFSRHAAEKIESGEVCEELIMTTLFSGEKELEEEPNKYCARKRFRRGTLEVIYKEHFEQYFVITAYWAGQ